MCCFVDCKCKSLNRLRENIKQTGHPPAHHSAANKYLSGSGWMSCIFVFDVFLRLVVFVVTRVCSLTHAKAQKDNAKRKASRKTKQQKIKLILPEFERYLFAVEWWAGGCPVFCCFCFYRRLFVVRLFCCFCLVFLSLCMYKRKTIVNTKNKSSRKATTNNNTAHPAGT